MKMRFLRKQWAWQLATKIWICNSTIRRQHFTWTWSAWEESSKYILSGIAFIAVVVLGFPHSNLPYHNLPIWYMHSKIGLNVQGRGMRAIFLYKWGSKWASKTILGWTTLFVACLFAWCCISFWLGERHDLPLTKTPMFLRSLRAWVISHWDCICWPCIFCAQCTMCTYWFPLFNGM